MVVDKRSFAEVVARQRLREASFASQDGSVLKVQRANKWEVCGVVGGSDKDVFGKGVTFAEQDNVSKVVGVCGKDVRTAVQALSKKWRM